MAYVFGRAPRPLPPPVVVALPGSGRLLKAVEDLLGEIAVLPLDVPADTDYAGIRAELEAAGKPIGSNDLLSPLTPTRPAPRS